MSIFSLMRNVWSFIRLLNIRSRKIVILDDIVIFAIKCRIRMIDIGFYIALRVILVFRRLVRLGMGIFVDLVLVDMT
jgi:hypothetical protein